MPGTESTVRISTTAGNIIQLVADYGSGLAALYRAQVREIERVVLGG